MFVANSDVLGNIRRKFVSFSPTAPVLEVSGNHNKFLSSLACFLPHRSKYDMPFHSTSCSIFEASRTLVSELI